MLEIEYKKKVFMGLMAQGWDVQFHEDSVSNFIPDVSMGGHGVDVWIEVKYEEHPPKKISDIKHWTRGQEKWLKDRGRSGCGFCYLLIGSGHEHMLFRWNTLNNIRKATWEDAAAWACVRAGTIPGIVKAIDDWLTTEADYG